MNYHVVETNPSVGTVEVLCGALGVSVSGYYARRKRQDSHRHVEKQHLLDVRQQVYAGAD